MHATAVTVTCACAYVAARQSGARSHTVAGHCQPCHDHDTETKNKEPASLTTVVCQAFRLSLSAVLLFVFGDCKRRPLGTGWLQDRCSSSAKQAHISSQLSIPVTVRCCRMDHLCFAWAPSFSLTPNPVRHRNRMAAGSMLCLDHLSLFDSLYSAYKPWLISQ